VEIAKNLVAHVEGFLGRTLIRDDGGEFEAGAFKFNGR
jgi:hypothetical protein